MREIQILGIISVIVILICMIPSGMRQTEINRIHKHEQDLIRRDQEWRNDLIANGMIQKPLVVDGD